MDYKRKNIRDILNKRINIMATIRTKNKIFLNINININ